MALGRVRALRSRKPLLEALVERAEGFSDPNFVPYFSLKFALMILIVPAFAAAYLVIYFHSKA